MSEFSVILFYSTNHALWTARILKKAGCFRKMTPIPRHLSSDCGYCVQIYSSEEKVIQGLLEEKGVEYDRIEPLSL